MLAPQVSRGRVSREGILRTRAWLGSSGVRDRRFTSGRFTLPTVTPWLMYFTSASPTIHQNGGVSCYNLETGVWQIEYGSPCELPSTPIARWASSVLPPMCGVRMRFLRARSCSPQLLRSLLK